MIRWRAVLDPLLKRSQQVKHVGPIAITQAVHHAWDHEQPVETLHGLDGWRNIPGSCPVKLSDAQVIAIARPGLDPFITPPVKMQQLAAALLKRAQVGIRGVQYTPPSHLRVDDRLIITLACEVERLPVPLRVGEYQPAEITDGRWMRIAARKRGHPRGLASSLQS